MNSYKNKQTHKKTKISKRLILITIIIVVIICICSFFILPPFFKKNSTTTKTVDTTSNNSSTTPQSVPVSSNDKTTDNSSTVNTSSNVSIVIVDANKYVDVFEVRSYAMNVVEDGTCTFSFTNNAETIIKTSKAIAGSSTTSCTTLDIAISELASSSSWKLTVLYTSTSGAYKGESSENISTD